MVEFIIRAQGWNDEEHMPLPTTVLLNLIALRKARTPPNFPTIESTVLFCGAYTLEGVTFGGISAGILKTASQAK